MSPRISYDELAKQNVAKLLKYATEHLFLDDADYFYAQNQLLDALKIQQPGEYPDIIVGDIYDVVESLSAYAVRKKLIEENERLLFETKLIGYCMPAPSKVIETFDDIASYEGLDKACDYLHRLGIDSLYLRQKDFDKNIIWKHDATRGDIIVTINLSKPEKNARTSAPCKRSQNRLSKMRALRRESRLCRQRGYGGKTNHSHDTF